MICRYLILISFIGIIVCFWNRDNLPEQTFVFPELESEPVQQQVEESAFVVEAAEMRYQIQPLYSYELYGLVVSLRHHDGEFGLHKLWGDHLNVADVCVVWSNNASRINLSEYDFYNGQFTCNISTKSREAWQRFNMDKLSNNHLLTTDKRTRSKIESVSIGDQIRIKGWLSEYSNGEGNTRGTSITRTDTGNGACETIFVQEFEVLSEYVNGWRKGMYFFIALFLFSLIWYLKTPYRPPH